MLAAIAARLESFHDALDRRLQHRYWIPVSVAIAWALAIGFSVPGYTVANRAFQEQWSRAYRTNVVNWKVDDPLADMTLRFDIHTNEAKRTYRITAPAMAYATRTGVDGAYRFNYLCNYFLLHGAILLAASLTGRRTAGLYVGLLLAATYIGTSSFKDLSGWFDATTFAFVILAATVRGPLLCGAAVLLALFSDERALLVGVLAIPTLAIPGAPAPTREAWRARILAVAGAYATYLGIRGVLTFGWGIGATPIPIPWEALEHSLSVLRLSLWTPLEGGWLIVAAATWLLLREKERTIGLAYAAYFVAFLAANLFVFDTTRSISFGFLFLFPILPYLRERLGNRLPSLLLAAAVVSLLSTNVFVLPWVDYERPLWAHLWTRH
jgi:hypothetical protein